MSVNLDRASGAGAGHDHAQAATGAQATQPTVKNPEDNFYTNWLKENLPEASYMQHVKAENGELSIQRAKNTHDFVNFYANTIKDVTGQDVTVGKDGKPNPAMKDITWHTLHAFMDEAKTFSGDMSFDFLGRRLTVHGEGTQKPTDEQVKKLMGHFYHISGHFTNRPEVKQALEQPLLQPYLKELGITAEQPGNLIYWGNGGDAQQAALKAGDASYNPQVAPLKSGDSSYAPKIAPLKSGDSSYNPEIKPLPAGQSSPPGHNHNDCFDHGQPARPPSLWEGQPTRAVPGTQQAVGQAAGGGAQGGLDSLVSSLTSVLNSLTQLIQGLRGGQPAQAAPQPQQVQQQPVQAQQPAQAAANGNQGMDQILGSLTTILSSIIQLVQGLLRNQQAA